MSGQADPSALLRDALVLENRGNFATAINVARAAIDRRHLSATELGRGYIILAVGYEAQGDLANAQITFERALQALEHDRVHSEDYASALENYALFYGHLGQCDAAARMLRKALALRQGMGDHTAAALSLIRLAGVALERNRLREARDYLQRASDEVKASPDFIDDDKALLYETRGWLALAEQDSPAAVAAYQRALELVERSRGEQHWLAGWEHMLLGKAYADSGNFMSASANMQTGLTILDHALGQKNLKYITAELAYSKVLDQFGLHAEATQMRAAGEKAGKDYYGGQCPGCTINVAAFH